MQKFIVEGGHRLKGVFMPAGNKNETLPVIAACLLTDEQVILKNVPDILDARTMMQIAESLAVTVSKTGTNTFALRARNPGTDPDQKLCEKIRGSFLFAGPLLARAGSIRLPKPGGDKIGRRRLDTHLLALRELGAEARIEGQSYVLTTDRPLQGTNIFLDEASVMATENAVMAAVTAEGSTTISNAACEPHVQGLCRMLNKMGAKIGGIGSNILRIEGVNKLSGCEHEISSDHIEIASIIGLAAVTNSPVVIRNVNEEYLRMIRLVFRRLGIEVETDNGELFVSPGQELTVRTDIDGAIPKIDDAPWPGFPADLTSIAVVCATQCKGEILIFEKMFESRLFFVDKLITMGARIVLCDPHRAVVSGPTPLHGELISTPDIRAGMALLIAAMCADGVSTIQNVDQLDRGYERIDERLNALGAVIRRQD